MRASIAILGGDGIGPEVVAESIKVLDAISTKFNHDFDLKKHVMIFCYPTSNRP